MTGRRHVRVAERFFAQLDELLPPKRSATGTPSAADFLLYEIPLIIERLATDFEGSTAPIEGADNIRVLITSGILIRHIAAYALVHADGSVDLVALEIDRSR